MSKSVQIIALLLFFALTSVANSNIQFKIDSLESIINTKGSVMTNSEKAETLSQIGSMYYKIQKYPQSIVIKKQALEIYHADGDKSKEIEMLEQIGILYSLISNYNESVYYLLEALKIAEAEGNESIEYGLILNIGITHIEATNYTTGLEYLHKCKNYYKKDAENSDNYLSVIYTNLGVVHQKTSQLDSAQIYYHRALEIFENSSAPGIGGVLINLGDLYVKLDSFQEAEIYYNEAIDYFNSVEDKRGYWHSYYGLAKLALNRENFEKAKSLYSDAISNFIETEDLAYLSESYFDMSMLHRKTGNPDMALDYYIQYAEIKDSISSGEVVQKIVQLEMQYEIEKLEQQNKIDIELIKKEKQLSTYRWYIVSGILIIFLILVITLLYRHKTRKKLLEAKLNNSELQQKHLEEDLVYQRRELENFALHIVHKNDFLQSIKTELNEIKGKESAVVSQKTKEISMKITQSLRRNEDVEKLQKRIKVVHSGFLKTLGLQFPQLTEKENRLCVMLKLDLSSKEIAVLNNITENAVMMARYRMRKKMNLSSEENLVDFLQKLN